MGKTMKEYMLEQPAMLRDIIPRLTREVERLVSETGTEFKKIFLVASGTSLNAAYAAGYMFTDCTDSEIRIFTPLEFLLYFPEDRLDAETMVLGISQTARSTGTIQAVEKAEKCGAVTVFVTAGPDSEGAKSARYLLDICVGEELVGAKTKGFTATVAALYLLAAKLPETIRQMDRLPLRMEQTIQATGQKIGPLTERLRHARALTILGYGPCMAAAREGGLKFSETVRVPVEVYDVEEFMHGPYHCLSRDSCYIFLAPPGRGQERMGALIRFIDGITVHTLVIADEEFTEQLAGSGFRGERLALPALSDERLSVLEYIIPLQWLANDVTLAKGRRPEVSAYPEFHRILGSKYMPAVNYYTGI